MARASHCAQLLASMVAICLVGFARSDFASDQKECGTTLVGLATCLSYVQGQAKTPTPDCCSALKQFLAKSRKCLCVLIKDRDDPNLGLNINATLAFKLPGVCGSSVNATECIDLLHLAPNSSDAQIFKQLASGNQVNSTSGSKGHTPTPSTSSTVNGTGAASSNAARCRGKARWARDVVLGVWIWCFVWLAVMDG